MKSFYSGIYWKIFSIRRKLTNQERLGIPETEGSKYRREEPEFFRTASDRFKNNLSIQTQEMCAQEGSFQDKKKEGYFQTHVTRPVLP